MAPTHILPIFTIPSTIQNADAEADGTTNVHILFGDFPSDFWIGHSQNHGSSAYSDFFTSEKNQSSIADTEADGSTNVNHDVNIPFGPWELDHDSSVYFDCSSAANRVANNELAIAEAEAYATWNANIPFSPWELDHDLSAYFDCSSAANNQSGIMSGMVEHFPTMDMPLDMERAPPMAPPPSMPPSLISEDDLALDLSPNYAPNLERHLEALKTCVEINATINELLLQMNGFNLKVAEMALNGLHLGLQQQQQQLSEQFQESKLPPGYICHVCFSNKHFIQHCPSVRENRPTTHGGIERSFGEYVCTKCKRTWLSAYSWADVAQQCRRCKINIFPSAQACAQACAQRPLRSPGKPDTWPDGYESSH